MLDIKFVRENPELVKENIKKKFQDAKLPLVDEVIALDAEYRAAIAQAELVLSGRTKPRACAPSATSCRKASVR